MLITCGFTLRFAPPIRIATFPGSGCWTQPPATLLHSDQVETISPFRKATPGILCSTKTAQWSYALDGSETRKQIGEESRSSVIKWEGAALLINTQVTGSRHYTVMDRWELSRSHNTLTITRQVVRSDSEAEGTLVFRREGAPVPASPPADTGRVGRARSG
jgi:hypothetical protein